MKMAVSAGSVGSDDGPRHHRRPFHRGIASAGPHPCRSRTRPGCRAHRGAGRHPRCAHGRRLRGRHHATIQQLDGELIVFDGRAWSAAADGSIRELSPDTLTPFAVVTHFEATVTAEITEPLALAELHTRIDQLSPGGSPVVAVRIDGEFRSLSLRSVEKQSPPYLPLREVVAHQTEWAVPAAVGTLLGFRFPDATAGVEVPGYHLHFISRDRAHGGHVLDLAASSVNVAIDHEYQLKLVLPESSSFLNADLSEDPRAALEQAESKKRP
ncbi:MAG: acetolactate decarboxylase [Actinobacteria bacterium]|nr:acetolactate decarboxylase [Actinomycetota bacterium]